MEDSHLDPAPGRRDRSGAVSAPARNTLIVLVLLLPVTGFLARLYAFLSVGLPDGDFVAWSTSIGHLIFTGLVVSLPIAGFAVIFFASLGLASVRGWVGGKRLAKVAALDLIGGFLLVLLLPGWPGTLLVAAATYAGCGVINIGQRRGGTSWSWMAGGLVIMISVASFSAGTWGPLPLSRVSVHVADASSVDSGDFLELGRTSQTVELLRCKNMWYVYEVPYSEVLEITHQDSNTWRNFNTISLLQRLEGLPGRPTRSPLRCFWEDSP
jgi:hypothetical protein